MVNRASGAWLWEEYDVSPTRRTSLLHIEATAVHQSVNNGLREIRAFIKNGKPFPAHISVMI